MIHRFLRESEQLDLKLPPDYRSFKWMARHAFRFVWLDRAMARMAESATQRCYAIAEEAAARRIALTCLEQLERQMLEKSLEIKDCVIKTMLNSSMDILASDVKQEVEGAIKIARDELMARHMMKLISKNATIQLSRIALDT
jgi:hypothetical protein